jgi:hypothetical protein
MARKLKFVAGGKKATLIGVLPAFFGGNVALKHPWRRRGIDSDYV